ncbi:RlpA-like double-psi beta-barrel-protein domain-containing protein-containing protein [Auriculariales sp. MPI-PUGE-AT-0066]|nr:RlpA-like double-psi beta-barrel-protein domain-containing protein-containing protein [Auriculariales sp. MPI-PUGE-AT-0066]
MAALRAARSLLASRDDDSANFTYPSTGYATMTHYDLPLDYVASCGCAPASTHYPTAALSQLAYGSAQAFGPGCGKCFKLTLVNTFLSTPPYYPPQEKSLVVKVTDLCPIWSDWCTATQDEPNKAGNWLNFDLAYPSKAIPDDFFPSDEALYGYKDFGVWNISYTEVACTGSWDGAGDASAMGSVNNLGDSVCCPGDVKDNVTCPSYSAQNGIPPDTSIAGTASYVWGTFAPFTWLLALSAVASAIYTI